MKYSVINLTHLVCAVFMRRCRLSSLHSVRFLVDRAFLRLDFRITTSFFPHHKATTRSLLWKVVGTLSGGRTRIKAFFSRHCDPKRKLRCKARQITIKTPVLYEKISRSNRAVFSDGVLTRKRRRRGCVRDLASAAWFRACVDLQ